MREKPQSPSFKRVHAGGVLGGGCVCVHVVLPFVCACLCTICACE